MNRFATTATLALSAALAAPASYANGNKTGSTYDIEWASDPNLPTVGITYNTTNFGISLDKTNASSGSFTFLAEYNGGSEQPGIGQIGAYTSVVITVPKDIQLRFSYWRLDAQWEVVDGSTGTVLGSGSQTFNGGDSRSITIGGSLTDIPHMSSIRFSNSYAFYAGNSLTPSLDPSCAAFSCMTLNSDVASVAHSAYGTLWAVPEPSTYGMYLVGLGIAALARRRRRH